MRAAGHHSTNVSGHMAWSGLAAAASLTTGDRRTNRYGWIWRSHVVPARSSGTTISSPKLLSPPHDIPAATLKVGTTSTLPPVEDAATPVVIARRITPANWALRYLEAGTLGASEPHHVPWRTICT